MKLKQLLEELDPVGKTEKGKKVGVGQIRDIDNDGDIDSSDSYLAHRRKKVTDAMKNDKKDLNEGFDSDESVARELKIFIDNDGDLYRQRTMPIMKNLARKMRKGNYDPSKAVKLWMYLADAGAQKYTKDLGSPGGSWHEMFPKNIRLIVAKELAKDFEGEIEVGGLDIDDLAMRESRTMSFSKTRLKEMVRQTVRKQLNEGHWDGGVDQKKSHDMLDMLRNHMDDTQILDELMQAMSEREAVENLEHIMDMWEIS